MTTLADLNHLALSEWANAPRDQWWKHAAVRCLARGEVQIITGRRSSDVYLLRCWLSEPRVVPNVANHEEGRNESGSSLLLHHFLQPDDDGALHDHPWDFVTECLAGGYTETRPIVPPSRDADALGPAATSDRILRAGMTNVRLATDLHTVARIEPDTWTLMRTGPRVRSWFFHPAGQRRIPWRDYLASLGKDVPAPRAVAAS